MLVSQFKGIRMQEDETFNEFYIKLNVVRNSMINLGKNVSNAKLIKKIMRSLSKRFRIKVTTIKESKDLDTMKIEELVGSLQTYEFSLPQPKKNKFIALKTVRKKRNNSSDEESMYEEDMALIVRKFNRLFKTGKGNFRNTYSKFAEKPNDDSSVATIGRREREKTLVASNAMSVGVMVTFGLTVQIYKVILSMLLTMMNLTKMILKSMSIS
jgi:RNA-binding protein YhbY